MPREQITIKTKDGDCPTSVFTPEGTGPWPAAIYYVDGLAIRPSVFVMAQRLADAGYVVLVPDMFYRFGPYAPLDPKEVFAQPDIRKALGAMFTSTDNRRAAEDTEAFLAYLDTRTDVKGKQVGVTGYCMGGGIALTAAGTYPDRIAAAASFHGGNLASDSELSPHLLADKIKARVYIGVAANDNSTRRKWARGWRRPSRRRASPMCRSSIRRPCTAGPRRTSPSTTSRRRRGIGIS
jgi:carboxymethylenebutenolidase